MKTIFQKMYADEPDKWVEISEENARAGLLPYYDNIDEVISYLKSGGKARTPWAFYRIYPQKEMPE